MQAVDNATARLQDEAATAAEEVKALKATLEERQTGTAAAAEEMQALRAAVEEGRQGTAAAAEELKALKAAVEEGQTGTAAAAEEMKALRATVEEGRRGTAAATEELKAVRAAVDEGRQEAAKALATAQVGVKSTLWMNGESTGSSICVFYSPWGHREGAPRWTAVQWCRRLNKCGWGWEGQEDAKRCMSVTLR